MFQLVEKYIINWFVARHPSIKNWSMLKGLGIREILICRKSRKLFDSSCITPTFPPYIWLHSANF